VLNAIFGTRRAPAMGAEEVRALRDELGWTQEQLADAAEVSPLEVSAWEAGVVPVLTTETAVLARVAWRERRERAWGGADARPCSWGADAYARVAYVQTPNLDDLVRTKRVLRVHRKRCAQCRRAAEVDRALPPIPLDPLPLSPAGFLARAFRSFTAGERLPALPRFLLRLSVMGAWLALAMMAAALATWIEEPSRGFQPSLEPMLLTLAWAAGWLLADESCDDLPLDWPHAGGFLSSTLSI
jgi:DNA-binding XRE family transcriptional regulator